MRSGIGWLALVAVAGTLIASGMAVGRAPGTEQALRTAITSVNAAAEPFDASAPLRPNPRDYREPTQDAGKAADIAAVKRDVVRNLRRDMMIMRPRDVPADLKAQLGEVYAASVLDTMTRETAAAMRAAAEDPRYREYDDYRFVPMQWQGVQATPGAAVVTVLGRDSWSFGGTWRNDEALQVQMVLAREDGRWKIVEKAAFDPAERAPRDGE